MSIIPGLLLLLLLTRFSVQLCVTPQMAAHQAPPSLDSPGKNTGVGCHFLLQCMNVKSEREVAQSCPTLRDPMDCMQPTRLLRPWLTNVLILTHFSMWLSFWNIINNRPAGLRNEQDTEPETSSR